MEEQLIGKITHFFNNINVAVVEITEGELKVGDKIHIKGATSDFEQEVDSMQVEHENVQEAKAGQAVGMKTVEPVREDDEVYKIIE